MQTKNMTIGGLVAAVAAAARYYDDPDEGEYLTPTDMRLVEDGCDGRAWFIRDFNSGKNKPVWVHTWTNGMGAVAEVVTDEDDLVELHSTFVDRDSGIYHV